MPAFMLLLHRPADEEPARGGSDEFVARMREYLAWTDRIRAQGRYGAGNKLTDDAGRIVRAAHGGSVRSTDGPFAESKEIVGGFYLIKARDYEDACQVVTDCPHLKYGYRIEVRQIEEQNSGL
jgi:hypothetical protein